PVYNAFPSENLEKVKANPGEYGLASAEKPDGRQIHGSVIKFEQLNKSEFCVSCHQVAVNLGIKLEVVWDQYRASPAAEKGVTCQDCHMGKGPGAPMGFNEGPVAMVNGRSVGDPKSRHFDHAFFGPGYPIAHPGVFPFNPRSLEWSIDDW